jgi:gliding motility-associated-like protein
MNRTKFFLKLVIFFSGFLSYHSSFAKVKYTVRLASDSVTYQVYLKPDLSYPAPLNTTNSAQVTLVVPNGGFKVSNLKSIKGNWRNNVTVASPIENPNSEYFAFALTGTTTQITYVSGVEVLLFTFQNSGICTGKMHIIETSDPFYPPNMIKVASGNQIGFFGGGPGNSWSGNYESGDSDCSIIIDPTPCTDKWDDTLLPDTLVSCGGIPIQARINTMRTDSISWSPNVDISCINCVSPLFTKPSNKQYSIKIPAGNGCFLLDTIRIISLANPLFSLITEDPKDCTSNDGSIEITGVNSVLPVEYAIQNINAFQPNPIFKNLPKGDYKVYVKTIYYNCINTSLVKLTCDTSTINTPIKVYSKISGTAFFDCSNPGIFDNNEIGMPNILVSINGRDSLNNLINRSTKTNTQGTYILDSIPTGVYTIQFQKNNKLIFSQKNLGFNYLIDSDVNPVTGITDTFQVNYNRNVEGINAGYRDITAPLIIPKHPLLTNINNGDTIYMDCGATTVLDETGALGTDNYDPNINIEFLEEETSFGDCNTGYLMKMRCGFRAVDNCGNESKFWFNVIVHDTIPPKFSNLPNDTIISSITQLPNPPLVTATDLCTENIKIDFDSIWEINPCDSVLIRSWKAIDGCGNEIISKQRISIRFCECPKAIIIDSILVENTFCQKDDGSIAIFLQRNPQNYTFEWFPNIGLSNLTGNERNRLLAGVYSIEIRDKNNTNCVLQKEITVTDTCYCIPPNVNNIFNNSESCDKKNGSISIEMEQNPSFYQFRWTPNVGSYSSNNSTRNGLPSGNYSVLVQKLEDTLCFVSLNILVAKDTTGCSAGINDSQKVIANNHGFSPNGDGWNDFLVLPEVETISNYTITIYNRWGNEIFKTNNYEHTWDGTWQGIALPDGTYFMVIQVKDHNPMIRFIELKR